MWEILPTVMVLQTKRLCENREEYDVHEVPWTLIMVGQAVLLIAQN